MVDKKQDYFISNYTDKEFEGFIDQKGQADFLSWDKAYYLCMKKDPGFSYKYHRDENGRPFFVSGKLVWAEVETTMFGHTKLEIFPFMEGNRSVDPDKLDNNALNKQLKRALVKCIGLHGLGLRLWTREDLPDDEVSYSNESNKSYSKPKQNNSKEKMMTESQKNALLSKFRYGRLQLSQEEKNKIENCQYTMKEVQPFFEQ